MALRAACSGIEVQEYTHTPLGFSKHRHLISLKELLLNSVAVDGQVPPQADLYTASKWRRRDTAWTDGSRQDDGRPVLERPGGCTGRRYHLGTNMEVFDTETFAVYQALRALERRQESGHRYTIFVDSRAAIDRVRSDTPSPGQRFAVAAIEVCTRIPERDNSVTIRWVPAHSGASGNEVADEHTKTAATGDAPSEEIPDGYHNETSLSHMTRVATEDRSSRDDGVDLRARRGWATVQAPLGMRPPPPRLRRVRETLTGRYYQLLAGHAATGSHLLRIKTTDTSECWWCASGEPQSWHHFFTRCRAWAPQARRVWESVGKACEWRHPRIP